MKGSGARPARGTGGWTRDWKDDGGVREPHEERAKLGAREAGRRPAEAAEKDRREQQQ